MNSQQSRRGRPTLYGTNRTGTSRTTMWRIVQDIKKKSELFACGKFNIKSHYDSNLKKLVVTSIAPKSQPSHNIPTDKLQAITQFVKWRLASKMRIGSIKSHQKQFKEYFGCSFADANKYWQQLRDPAATALSTQITVLGRATLVPVAHSPLARIVLHICTVTSATGRWSICHLKDNDMLILYIGYDSSVRQNTIGLFTIAPLHCTNRDAGTNAIPYVSFVGKENRQYLQAVLAATHMEQEVKAVQGSFVMVQGKRLAIRFALHCDNAAHHKLSQTSPPNFGGRSPQGNPCPWCCITHAELQAWHIGKLSRIMSQPCFPVSLQYGGCLICHYMGYVTLQTYCWQHA